MVVSFCLRLAAGLMMMLPFLPSAQIPPRFYRVHFLTALGLVLLAGGFLQDTDDKFLWIFLVLALLGCLIGSIVWHLDEHPGGTWTIFVTPVALTASLIHGGMLQRGATDSWLRIGDDAFAALLLGSATTAMLMGHSYLISPSMSLTPLMRLLAILATSVVLRIGLSSAGLWWWTSSQSLNQLETELLLWLPVRWVLGLIAPLILGWMAFETARIRSTQSATGILYVVVIVCFVGELTSQLLVERTHLLL